MIFRLAAVVLCILGGCQSLPKGVAPTLTADSAVMTTAEINATLVGRNTAGTIIGSGGGRGTTWTQTTPPDGTLRFAGSDGSKDTGRRVVRDNASCENWNSFGSGGERCYKFVRYGSDQFVSYRPNGDVGSISRIVP